MQLMFTNQFYILKNCITFFKLLINYCYFYAGEQNIMTNLVLPS